ncbi:membrane protein [Pseudomonas aeruginosa]|nr:membrane protein [Pseudomonas aeruginosa]
MNLLQGKWPRLATLLAVLVAAALVFLAWERYTRTPWTRDARVRADVVTLSADVSGLITRLPLSDNQPVEKGDLLLSIDPARYELAVLRAERAVNVARAALGESRAAIEASQAQLRQRRSGGAAALGIAEALDAIGGRERKGPDRRQPGPGRVAEEPGQPRPGPGQRGACRSRLAAGPSRPRTYPGTRPGQRLRDQPADPRRRLRPRRGAIAGAGGPRFVLCQRILRGDQVAGHPRRQPGAGGTDERRALRRARAEHRPCHHRPGECRGLAPAGEHQPELYLGQAGPANSGAHRHRSRLSPAQHLCAPA